MPELTSQDDRHLLPAKSSDADRLRSWSPTLLLPSSPISGTHLAGELTGVADGLMGRGRRAVVFDVPRYQTSGLSGAGASGEDELGGELMRLADQLDVGRYDLVGYSTGAVISLRVAARDPRVRRLVVAGVGAAVVRTAPQGCPRIFLGRIRARTLILAGASDPLAALPEVLAQSIQDAALRELPGDSGSPMDPAFVEAVLRFIG
jgi:pimeloyl-ACP methyl ester carboxylesterase